MKIEYQNTKADYTNFYKNYFATQLQKRIVSVVIYALCIAFVAGGQPFHWRTLVIVFFVSSLIIAVVGYFIPYLVATIKLNKAISKEPFYLDNCAISTTDTGLLIQSQSKRTEWNWESIDSFDSNDNYIYIKLADKKIRPIPKRFFSSEYDVINFLGIIQTGIIKVKGTINKPSQTIVPSSKPPYLLGLLCLIPLIGAFVGLVFIVLGITRFKDKWFALIGAFGILFTIAVYSLLFYAGKHATIFKEGFAKISQMQLNSLLKNIEFYKLQYGQYPDSLQELLKDDKLTPVNDAIQSSQLRENSYYNYERVGEKYLLFSSGQDGIQNTKDDLYPEISTNDSSKIGFIKSK